MFNKLLIVLFLLGVVSCHTVKNSSTSAPILNNSKIVIAPDTIEKYIIGTWKITDINNLQSKDTTLNSFKDKLIKKMISISKIEIRIDHTYTDNTFEGIETGKWVIDSKSFFYKLRNQGGTDTLKFLTVSPDFINGIFGTTEGATANFTIARVK